MTARATDVIVVGAGPAGAATAILLAERGVAVQLLDRARFPRRKVCGEYLSPEAPRVLDRLGVLKRVDGLATPLAGMRITAPDGSVLIGTYRTVGDWRPYREHANQPARGARPFDQAHGERAVAATDVDRDERVARVHRGGDAADFAQRERVPAEPRVEAIDVGERRDPVGQRHRPVEELQRPLRPLQRHLLERAPRGRRDFRVA